MAGTGGQVGCHPPAACPGRPPNLHSGGEGLLRREGLDRAHLQQQHKDTGAQRAPRRHLPPRGEEGGHALHLPRPHRDFELKISAEKLVRETVTPVSTYPSAFGRKFREILLQRFSHRFLHTDLSHLLV